MQIPGLRRARELAGFTQTQLAEALDMSQDMVSKWETGRRGARPDTAKKIADILGVSTKDLVETTVPLVGASR